MGGVPLGTWLPIAVVIVALALVAAWWVDHPLFFYAPRKKGGVCMFQDILTAAIGAIVVVFIAGCIVILAVKKPLYVVAAVLVLAGVAAIAFLPHALAEPIPVVEGNIDLDNRVVLLNADGTFSTELSFSVEIDGLEVLLPLIINGKLVSEEEAIRHFLDTGKHLGMFACVEDAEEYSELLHLRQEKMYGAAE